MGFRIEDVRQQSGNDRSIGCAANIYVSSVRPHTWAVNNPATGAPWTKEVLDSLRLGTNAEAVDITYTVEKLDAGGYYVTVRGG
jgi:hypothetical protein